jgi:ribosome-binding protein aMBF1 (putative translation factor)
VVRAENEKKATEANAPAAAPSAPATNPEDDWRQRIRAAREQLAKLQNDLANLRNADNEDLQSINRTLLQLTDLGAMIKKLEEEGKLKQFLEIPK